MASRKPQQTPADSAPRGGQVAVRLSSDEMAALGESPTAAARQIIRDHLAGRVLTLGHHEDILSNERQARAQADADAEAEITSWAGQWQAAIAEANAEVARLRRALAAAQAELARLQAGDEEEDDDEAAWEAGRPARCLLAGYRGAVEILAPYIHWSYRGEAAQAIEDGLAPIAWANGFGIELPPPPPLVTAIRRSNP